MGSYTSHLYPELERAAGSNNQAPGQAETSSGAGGHSKNTASGPASNVPHNGQSTSTASGTASNVDTNAQSTTTASGTAPNILLNGQGSSTPSGTASDVRTLVNTASAQVQQIPSTSRNAQQPGRGRSIIPNTLFTLDDFKNWADQVGYKLPPGTPSRKFDHLITYLVEKQVKARADNHKAKNMDQNQQEQNSVENSEDSATDSDGVEQTTSPAPPAKGTGKRVAKQVDRKSKKARTDEKEESSNDRGIESESSVDELKDQSDTESQKSKPGQSASKAVGPGKNCKSGKSAEERKHN